MAQKLMKQDSSDKKTFPPEADGVFEAVPTQKISEWREKLNERFGLGQGNLKVISEPSSAQ